VRTGLRTARPVPHQTTVMVRDILRPDLRFNFINDLPAHIFARLLRLFWQGLRHKSEQNSRNLRALRWKRENERKNEDG